MRSSRRWMFFLVMVAAIGGGWWLLRVRPTGTRDEAPGHDESPASSAPADSGTARADINNRPDADDGPPEIGLADVSGPPVPPGSDDLLAASGSSGLAEVFTPAGPLPENPAAIERLPAIDDGLEPAAHETAPAASPDLRMGLRAYQEGKLAEAERRFLAAIQASAGGPGEATRKLAEVYWLEGRFDEVNALAEDLWRAADRAGAHTEARELLNFHMALGLNPLPIDRMRAALDRAIGQAPQDDRVWLGRGYLALRDGRLAEAQSWFDACRRRRPDDPAVWRAQLEWGLAADRPADVREALPHLKAHDLPPARIHELRAWLAARRSDPAAERSALEQAVAVDPGRTSALERLAELAARDGRADDGARLRRRKAELDAALHRYRTLFRKDDPIGSTTSMARLAETLGRPFEAMALWSVVSEMAPGDSEARAARERLAAALADRADPGKTLADLFAEDLNSTALSVASRTAPNPAPSRRPIPLFRDDARSAGLDFTFINGSSDRKQLPEASSGGVGLLDYDGDGRLDVYLVQGGTFPPAPARDGSTVSRSPFGDRLFRNRGDGTFQDVTRASGLAAFPGGYGHGVAVGDYDNDGRPDLFITRWRAYVLYHNRGDGTFDDATAVAGLAGDRDWPTSAAFADLDGDGDLDLYVCHYLTWDADNPQICRSPSSGRVNPCDPLRFIARPDHLFRNERGRFIDVTREAGIVDRDGRGLGALTADFDDDGRVDIFVANDGTANFLFLNRGGMRFEESALESGLAAAGGGYRAGMGVARGDLDGDGRIDLAVTNFFGESTTFYQGLGGGLFTDATAAIGLAALSRYRLGFGVSFLDADDDGRLDLFTVNGHISDERPEIPYAMPAQLMLGGPDGRLTDVSAGAGAPFQVPRLGRGLAVGDLDGDNRLDAIIVGHEGPIAYVHQVGPASGHAITIRLEGTSSNRDAVGARVAIQSGGVRRVADRFGGGSYQSAGDPRLHFGLGTATKVDSLEVRWPSGKVDRFRDLAADAAYLVREGEPEVRRLHVPAPSKHGARRD